MDLAVARLQLAELQSSLQVLQDSRVALQLHFSIAELDDDPEGSAFDIFEEQQLQEQAAILQSLINAADDQQYALDSITAEEAAQAASLQLATALDAREQWEATVLRPHDAALARSIAGCSAKEWDERGLLLERPLDLTDQPAVADSVQHCIGGPSSSIAARPKPATACSIDQAASPTPTSSSSVSATACRPCGDAGNSSCAGQQERLHCGICFEAYPADSMLSARLPVEMASSSRAAGRCGHTYCAGCMGQYIMCELQVRPPGPLMPP
jgi:hypothetical protein